MHKRKALTLIELTAVLIIASTVTVIAIPNYQRTVEQARDKEAIACLRLIQAGERIYRSEQNPPQFFPWNGGALQNTLAINTGLRLGLTTPNPNWNFSVDDLAGAGGNNFDALAVRTTTGRTWRIRRDNCNNIFGPCCTGGDCPPDSTTCPAQCP